MFALEGKLFLRECAHGGSRLPTQHVRTVRNADAHTAERCASCRIAIVHTAERGRTSAPRTLCSHSAACSGWIQSPCHAGNHTQDDLNWAQLSQPIDQTDLIRMGDCIADGSSLLYHSDSQRAPSHVRETCFTTKVEGTSVFSRLQAAKSGVHVYTETHAPPNTHTSRTHTSISNIKTGRSKTENKQTDTETRAHKYTHE